MLTLIAVICAQSCREFLRLADGFLAEHSGNIPSVLCDVVSRENTAYTVIPPRRHDVSTSRANDD